MLYWSTWPHGHRKCSKTASVELLSAGREHIVSAHDTSLIGDVRRKCHGGLTVCWLAVTVIAAE